MAEERGTAPAPETPAGTPTEQPAPTTPAAAPEQRNDPQLVAAYTQATQLKSAVLTALGLPREAGTPQVIDAIAALKARQEASEPVDPRVQRDMDRANEALWRAQKGIYGESFVNDARALMDEASTLRDPEEFSTRLAALVQRQAQPSAAAASPTPEQPAAPPQQPNLSLGNEPVPAGVVEFSADEIKELRQDQNGPQGWYANLLARSRRTPQPTKG